MTAADQLTRIARAKPPAPVRIYKLDRGCDFWVWLCSKHLELRKRMGYSVSADKNPPHANLTCDDRNRGPCS